MEKIRDKYSDNIKTIMDTIDKLEYNLYHEVSGKQADGSNIESDFLEIKRQINDLIDKIDEA